MKGHTQTISATTLTRGGIERSPNTPVRLRACRYAIQSLSSAPFNLSTMNSPIENGSKLLKTTEAHFWRHFSIKRKSKTGYSTSFSRFPLATNLMNVSRNTSQPRTRATTDKESPTAFKSRQRTAISQLASPPDLLSHTHSWERVTVPHPNEPRPNSKTTGHMPLRGSQQARAFMGTLCSAGTTANENQERKFGKNAYFSGTDAYFIQSKYGY